jgi:hypothetical protein
MCRGNQGTLQTIWSGLSSGCSCLSLESCPVVSFGDAEEMSMLLNGVTTTVKVRNIRS